MRKIISVLLLVVIFLTSCNRVEYFEQAGWNATEENFQTDYYYAYMAKTEELKVLHNIECHIEEKFFQKGYYIYLYNDDFTIGIRFLNSEKLAFYRIDLFYYGDSEASRKDYEKQRPLVNFINDFTNYVAFDTKTDKNHFEALYYECSEEEPFTSNYYHYDSIVGNVGYYISLNTNAFGYYYKLQEDDDCMAICNCYRFEGLLKPIDVS